VVYPYSIFHDGMDDGGNDFNMRLSGYENGDIAPTGPHFRRGGYKSWNWCVKCECVWDKTHSWCKKCNSRLRFGGRYISRREKEKEK